MLLINHLRPRAEWQHLVFFSLLAHDALGRMTHDGTQNLDITYNYLDMPEKVSRNDTLLVKYSYLADGMKTGARRVP